MGWLGSKSEAKPAKGRVIAAIPVIDVFLKKSRREFCSFDMTDWFSF
jgi:hypothetical protein